MCHGFSVSSFWFLVSNSTVARKPAGRMPAGQPARRRRYFFFFGTDFLGAAFLAAAFFAGLFAAFASTLGSCSTLTGLTFFGGFASFFGRSGAENFLPS